MTPHHDPGEPPVTSAEPADRSRSTVAWFVSVSAGSVGVLFSMISFPTTSAKATAVVACCAIAGLVWQAVGDRKRGILSSGMIRWLAVAGAAVVVLVSVLAASTESAGPSVDASVDSRVPSQTPPEATRESPMSPRTHSEPPERDRSEPPPSPVWTVLQGPDAELNVPLPDDFTLTTVDIDEFVVETDVDDELSSDIDMIHDGAGVLWRADGAYVGFGPESEPEPEECMAAARSRAIGQLDAGDGVVDETAFCVLTTDGNVAWMLLVGKSDAPFPDLAFRVTMWANQA